MRVAVSRESVKGARAGALHDFHNTTEGDLLTLPPIVCEGPRAHRDRCGCGRSFVGLEHGGACTTAVVEERPEAEVLALGAKACVEGGWGEGLIPAFLDDLQQLALALGECELGATVRIESSPSRWRLLEAVAA